MNSTPDTALELRIARAYMKLSSVPEQSLETSVLLASIGNCEIRMFRKPEIDADGAPLLFWLELFDSTKRSVDGFGCHRLSDAVPILDDFISQAARLTRSH
jgi:hypothetical protein